MRLTFLGAAGEVTGSAYLLETGRARVLIDFGLHQAGAEGERRNRRRVIFRPENIDAVVLSHAHVDHSGRMPLLPRLGCRAPIYSTPASIAMTEILLLDAAKLQEQDAQRHAKCRGRVGRPCVVSPLYTVDDVHDVMAVFRPVNYDARREIAPGVTLRFVDAGHILGSTSIELTIVNGSATRTIVFSADIGVVGTPIIRDPTPLPGADVLVLESTYGDRDHRSQAESVEEFGNVLVEAHRDGAKVLVPAFAVGRTQALIYYISELHKQGRMPTQPVFIDSPMASQVTDIYRRCRDLYDDDMRARIAGGEAALGFRGLRFTASVEESKSINTLAGPAVIIAGSGMCNGGRIVHHLSRHLGTPSTRVVFVGYQAAGTLGRRLIEGAKEVRLFNQPVPVKARIKTINGFSAHAGQSALVQWASSVAHSRPRVFLTHGEDGPRAALAARLRAELGMDPYLPRYLEAVDI